ncbi:D-alanyl-lipoteichoic acid acyltransferase DltB (MBOAT superfamily) [Faecalicoccus acidiformans]|uniref:D-alanyl-lipoteichoic acid acyltransferase DltB (MBOAT superfamily) n=2 Tax=Faecalicoccus acidiformans TaxID=915173 RepID=A0A7W8FX48_9FIRM|nr:D-alanyl-lipoteichoic acid acyltransferase DltB (MBOAT superfamily) [Faecalicoccus acidiformans]
MYTNTMIVFFISGFWHGANYTFIIWGLIHGTILCMNKLLNEKFNRITPALRWIITFGIVMLCWVFFRSNNINDAIFIIKKIMVCDFQPLDVSLTNLIHFPEINMLLSFIGLSKMIEHTELMFVIAILLIFLYVMIEKNIILEVKENFIKFKKYRFVFLYCFMGFWSLLNMNEVVTFIYEMF